MQSLERIRRPGFRRLAFLQCRRQVSSTRDLGRKRAGAVRYGCDCVVAVLGLMPKLTAGPQADPAGAAKGSDHVVRGGSWNTTKERLPLGYRNSAYPGSRNGWMGFRLVRSIR